MLHELRARGPVNGTVYPAPTHQGGIGCVDDHVNVHRRDIAMNNVDLRFINTLCNPPFSSVYRRGRRRKTVAKKRRLTVIHLNDRKRFLFIQIFHGDSGQL